MYIFCRFDEVSAIRKPKMTMFSKTGFQMIFVDFVIYTKNERKTSHRFIVPTTTTYLRFFIPKLLQQILTCFYGLATLTWVDLLVSLAFFARAFLSTSFSSSLFGGSKDLLTRNCVKVKQKIKTKTHCKHNKARLNQVL